jgi:hypothetical protein
MTHCFRICLLLLIFMSGCTANKKEINHALDTYSFDQNVIDKLPVYDSLARYLLQEMSPLFQAIGSNEGYQAFRYLPAYNETGMFNKLPNEIKVRINDYFTQLGNNYIYGIDVFKDSSIKIHVRLSEGTKALVNMNENLSYLPEGKTHRKRQFPDRDTILTPRWQYWVRVDEQEFFQ